MFLILGILIVLFMITIRIAVEPAKRITRADEFDTVNIRNEFQNVQKYTMPKNYTMLVENLNNFTDFTQTRLAERSITFNSVYVNGFISSSDTSIITITVGNYLGLAMSDINVSFGNASGTQGTYLIPSLSNENHNSTNVTFSVLAEEKHINVTYTAGGIASNIFYTFTPKSGYSTVSTFFENNYVILDKRTKDKFIQTDHI